jgi:SAM-dependent methyltransferase
MTEADGTAARCLWCGAPVEEPSSPGLARCSACGAATTWPRPTEEELDEHYGSWYRPPSGRFAWPGDPFLRFARRSLARRLDRLAPPGSVLDVGSGDGTLLAALRARGRDAVGVERSPSGGDHRVADVTEIEGEWAAMVFFHSLEHLPAPAAALEHAARHLGRDGLLVVAAPNLDSLQARAFGERWFALDLPMHLVHLPARALVARIESLGLAIERVSFIRGGQIVFGWLDGLVGLLPGRPDLLDAIRRSPARRRPLSGARRAEALAGAAGLAPLAACCGAVEVGLRRGGTMYLEARRV